MLIAAQARPHKKSRNVKILLWTKMLKFWIMQVICQRNQRSGYSDTIDFSKNFGKLFSIPENIAELDKMAAYIKIRHTSKVSSRGFTENDHNAGATLYQKFIMIALVHKHGYRATPGFFAVLAGKSIHECLHPP